jgi:rhodanese-related sulfurtransferase
MTSSRLSLIGALMLGAAFGTTFLVAPVSPANANAVPLEQAKANYYKSLTTYEFVASQVSIPPKKGVAFIDSRPAARQYDPGHIPGAINIPDSQFDKLTAKLPEDKATTLVFYCGGLDCLLSHQSAAKAEKLGYTSIKVYAEGMPEWKAKGQMVAVSAAHIKKLIEEKADYVLIDSRPKRTADKGMIPTAILIPDNEFDKQVAKLPANKETPLIFYCGGLDCVLSENSAHKAKALGYKNVLTYPEGYPEWEKLFGPAQPAAQTTQAPAAAAPVAAAAPAPAAGKVALVPAKEKGSVTPASFKAVLDQQPGAILVVDVRDPKEYANGTIKGAINIPMNDLEKKIAELPKDKFVVFICGSGARSGEAYDTVKLYDAAIQAAYIDANIKYAGDGGYTIVEK